MEKSDKTKPEKQKIIYHMNSTEPHECLINYF